MIQFLFQNKVFSIILLVFSLFCGQVFLDSIEAEEYSSALVSALQVAIFAGALLIANRNAKKPSEDKFHPTKLWKTPYEATRAGLWVRAGFSGLLASMTFAGFFLTVWLFDNDTDIVFPGVLSIQFLFWIPYFYWNSRRQYELVSTNQIDDSNLLLRYSDNPRKPSSRERWILALSMGATAGTLAMIGVWLS